MALALIGLILFLLAPFGIGLLLAALRLHEEQLYLPIVPAPSGSRFRLHRVPERRLRRKLRPAA
jgi:hypothetical protein